MKERKILSEAPFKYLCWVERFLYDPESRIAEKMICDQCFILLIHHQLPCNRGSRERHPFFPDMTVDWQPSLRILGGGKHDGLPNLSQNMESCEALSSIQEYFFIEMAIDLISTYTARRVLAQFEFCHFLSFPFLLLFLQDCFGCYRSLWTIWFEVLLKMVQRQCKILQFLDFELWISYGHRCLMKCLFWWVVITLHVKHFKVLSIHPLLSCTFKRPIWRSQIVLCTVFQFLNEVEQCFIFILLWFFTVPNFQRSPLGSWAWWKCDHTVVSLKEVPYNFAILPDKA